MATHIRRKPRPASPLSLHPQLVSCYLAVVAFIAAVRSPAVLRSMRRAAEPLGIAALAQYAMLWLLLFHINIILRVVAYAVSAKPVELSVHRLVTSSLGIYPLLTIIMAKYVYTRSLEDCFFASLAEVDPEQAQRLASNELSQTSTITGTMLGMVTDDADDPWRMLVIMLAASLLRSWRWLRRGVLGIVVVPLGDFLGIRYMVGRPHVALVLTAMACLVPGAEPYVMTFVEAWASSRALGQSSMRHFLRRAVPKSRHAAFVRTFEAVIVTYFLAPTLLMRLPLGPMGPFLGPLVVFPAAAIAARCVHDITSRAKSGRVMQRLAGSAE